MKRVIQLFLTIFIILFVFQGCKDDDELAATGILTGTVTDAISGDPLANVFINIFNDTTNAPIGTSFTTGSNGAYTFHLEPGIYFMKLSKHKYESVPLQGSNPIPFTIEAGLSFERLVKMFPDETSNTGVISGKVTDGTDPLGGVLIIASMSEGSSALSSVSDGEGNYYVFNVPAGSYSVKGLISGYNGDAVEASVTGNLETSGVDLILGSGASGIFTGLVRHLSVENIEVDVALIHAATRETIPGLISVTENLAFTISNIPDGKYLARATFANDNRVMDPDRIAKFGEPEVTISGGNTVDLQIDVTGAVILVSPTNDSTAVEPLEITSTSPTFEWEAFASTSDYVIEVSDINGTVIWGGFSNLGDLPVKRIEIPSSQLMVNYNFDSTATVSFLELGRVYRWRIFASKNDQQSDTGWTLISASEDQRGLIKIAE